MHESGNPTWLTTTEVALPVRHHLGTNDSSITAWTCRQLIGGGGEGFGMWRLSGTAVTDGIVELWSMVLKGWPPQEPGAVPSAWNWPHRETAHRSGQCAPMQYMVTVVAT